MVNGCPEPLPSPELPTERAQEAVPCGQFGLGDPVLWIDHDGNYSEDDAEHPPGKLVDVTPGAASAVGTVRAYTANTADGVRTWSAPISRIAVDVWRRDLSAMVRALATREPTPVSGTAVPGRLTGLAGVDLRAAVVDAGIARRDGEAYAPKDDRDRLAEPARDATMIGHKVKHVSVALRARYPPGVVEHVHAATGMVRVRPFGADRHPWSADAADLVADDGIWYPGDGEGPARWAPFAIPPGAIAPLRYGVYRL